MYNRFRPSRRVRSTNGSSSAEDLGTSFATPLVSSALAQVYHQITPTPSPVLARALLTHHARPPNQCTRARRRGERSWIREASPAALLHRVHSKLVDVGIRRYYAPGLLS